MAMRIGRWRRFWNSSLDWIWPHLTGEAASAPEDQDHFDITHPVEFDDVNSVVGSRLAQAEERIRSVESKLMALLTLASVLSVAVTASLAAATTLGEIDEDAKVFAWIAVALVFYVAVQLLRSLWATVAGLMRKSYRQLSPEDMVPECNEAREIYRVRLLNLQLNHMRYNEWVVDDKVSQMAVAHTALKNALTATFAIILLALGVASVELASCTIVPTM